MQLINSLVILAATAQAHYHWTKTTAAGDKDFAAVRQPKNFQTNGFVGDVTSTDIRCDQMSPSTSIVSAAAGSTFGMHSEPAPYHPGPVQFYMAKAPEGTNISTWDGSGEVWFKTAYMGPTSFGSSGPVWPKFGSDVTFTIPKNTPSGDYLVRAEQIGLHVASTTGPQFYIACGQVKVTGGGSGTPGPLVSFPGAYKKSDPGLTINLNYPIPTSYTMPGPAVWDGK